MAGIVAVWIVLFAFLVGLPSSGDGGGVEGEIPVDVIGTDSESRDVQKSPNAFLTDFQNLSALKNVQLGDMLDRIQNWTIEQTTDRFLDQIWGALAVPMAALDSARDAILSIPDMLPRDPILYKKSFRFWLWLEKSLQILQNQ